MSKTIIQKHRIRRRGRQIASIVLGAAAACPVFARSAWAANFYWDTNGATAGAGATPTGTWDAATANWSTSSAGTVATTTWVNGNTAVFAAGTDATNAYTVTVSGSQTVAGLTFEEGTVTLSGGTLSLSSATATVSNQGATIGSILTGSTGMTKAGVGTLTLSGANTFTGGVTISAGTLQVSAENRLGDGTNGVTINGGTLQTTSTFTSTRTYTLGALGGTFAPNGPTALTINTALTANANPLVVNGTGGLLALTASSARTGTTTVSGGSLRVTNGSAMGTGAVFLNGTGQLELVNVSVNQSLSLGDGTILRTGSANATYAGTITAASSASVTLSSGIVNGLTIGDGANDYTGGSGTTTHVIGTGTVALPFSNNYAGDWIVENGGTLKIQNAGALGSGSNALVVTNGKFEIANVTLSRGTTLSNSATLRGTGNAVAAGQTGIAANAGVSFATTGASDTLTIGDSLNDLTGGGGTASITIAGPGTVIPNQQSNYAGSWIISGGTLRVGADDRLGGGAGNITNSGGTLAATESFSSSRNTSITNNASSVGAIDVAATKTLTLSGVISGGGNSGEFSKTGNGTLLLTGNSTWASDEKLAIGFGVVKLGTNNALPTDAFVEGRIDNPTGGAGSLDLNGFNQTLAYFTVPSITNSAVGASTLTINNPLTNGFNSAITGNVALVKNGAGTANINGTGSNTYTGNTTVNGGLLGLGKGAGGNGIGGNLIVNGGGTAKLNISNQIPDTATITLNSNGIFDLSGFDETIAILASSSSLSTVTNSSGTASTLTINVPSGGESTAVYSGVISGNTSLVFNSFSTASQTLLGNNTYTGSTTITSGNLVLGNHNVLPSGTSVAIGFAGGFNLSGYNQTIGGLSGGGGLTLSSGTLTVNSSASSTYSGVIGGGLGGLTKSGSGTLQLAGTSANFHAGLTNVSGGTLELNKPNSTDAVAGNVTVNNGGTLKWLADEQIPNSKTLTLNSGGTINLNGHNETVGSFVDNGGTTLIGGGHLFISTGGNLTLSDGTNITTDTSVDGDVIYIGTTTAATISGALDLTSANANHNFNINNGAAASDVIISGAITSGTTSITKTGAGTVQLSGVGSSIGDLTVNSGAIKVTAGSLSAANIAFVEGNGTLSGGTWTNSGFVTVGAATTTGSVTFDHTGGTLSTLGLYIGSGASSTGSYNLSGAAVVNTPFIQVGGFGTGTFNQSGGNVSTTGTGLYVGSHGLGTYNLNSGTLTVSGTVLVGNDNGATGTFNQTGGIATFASSLVLGSAAGTVGRYNLGAGSASVSSGALTVGLDGSGILNLSGLANLSTSGGNDVIVGLNGAGTVTQSGGSATFANNLRLGFNSGASGNYALSAGNLTANGEIIGFSGAGTFTHTGGVHTVSNGSTLILGSAAGGSGYYSLSGTGSLTVSGDENIGNSGRGTFIHTGGTHTVAADLHIAGGAGSVGSYSLSGSGVLSVASTESVGGGGNASTAVFNQSGGTNTAAQLTIDSSGSTATYNLSGGQLNVTTGPAGSSYETIVHGTFNQTGGTNNVTGAVAYLAIGDTGATGTFNLSGGFLNISGSSTGGLSLGGSGTGIFNHTAGTATVLALRFASAGAGTAIYSLSGTGSLSVASIENIGEAGAGTFAQSGGAHIASGAVYLGLNSGSTGVYNLSGGTLTASSSFLVGVSSNATFTQTGGSAQFNSGLTLGTSSGGNGAYNQSAGASNVVGALRLGAVAGATGSYTLSGTGILAATTIDVGYGGPGTFVQSGGVLTTGGLTIAQSLAPGKYTFSAGTINAANEAIGGGPVWTNDATFIQTGGTNNASTFTIGGSGGSSGTFQISAGSLSVTTTGALGISSQASAFGGTFVQTGGTASFGGNLTIGQVAPSAGNFSISAGDASAANIYVGGSSTAAGGPATLSVSGSGSLVTGNLKAWNTSAGQINLSGGSLSVASLDTQNNAAHFNWTAGTFTHASTLTIESGGQLGGSLTVGAGKVLNTADFFIGSNAVGSITINGGGVVNSNAPAGIVQLGGNSTATGVIDGAGSAWNVTATEFRIGNSAGVGIAMINGSALSITGDMAIARLTGTSSLDITGSTVSTSGSIYIGGSNSASGGNGKLNVSTGSTATAGGTIKVWNSNSSLVIGANATVTAAAFDYRSNTNTIAAGGVFNVGAGGISMSGTGGGSRADLNLAGDATNPARVLLSGDVTYGGLTGTATISSAPSGGQLRGILDLTNATRTFNIANGSAVNDLQISARITNGAIVKTGAGTLLIAAAADYTGATDINQGVLALGVVNALPSSSDVTVASGASLNMAGFSQTIGSLGGSGNVRMAGGSLTAGGSNLSTTFGGAITGSGSSFTKNGSGTMSATGVWGFTGGLTVNNGLLSLAPGNTFGGSQVIALNGTGAEFGVLSVGADSAMGATSNSINFAGGRLQITSSFATNRGITLNAGNGTFDVLSGVTFTPQFAISGSGGLNKMGLGTLAISANGTYTGTTNLVEGTIRAAGSATNRIPATTILTMASGTTLDLNGNSQSIATLIGDGSITLGGGTFTVGSGDSFTAFDGSVSGAGSIVKNGVGTQFLNGNLSFANGLTANTGEVALRGTASTFTGGISIGPSAAVSASNDGALGSAANIVNVGGTFSASSSFTSTHQIQVNSSNATVDVAAGQTLTLAADLSDVIFALGNVHKTSGGALKLTTATTFTPAFLLVDGGTLSLADNGTAQGIAQSATLLTGAALELDNTNINNTNRLPNSMGVLLNGGTFRFLGRPSASSTESTGTITMNPGASAVSLVEGSGGTNTVTFSGLSAASFPYGTLNFAGNSMGATNKVLFTGMGAGFMGARYTLNDVDFVDYGANGVVATTYTSTFTPNARVLRSSDITTGGATISTLSLDATANAVNVTQTGALNLDGILKFGGNTASVSGSTLSNQSSNYLYVHTTGGDLTIGSALKNGPGGSMALVKSGAGTLVLTSTDSTNHNITGGYYLNDGTLQVGSDANLGATAGNGSDITFYGGTLAATSSFTLGAGRTLTFNPNGGGINVVGSGTTLTAATSSQLVGASTSSWFNKTGAGTLLISISNQNFKGPVNIQAGTVELQNTGALGGTGPTWSTITLQPTASLTLKSDGPYPANFHSDVVITDNSAATPATINTARLTSPGTGTQGAYQLGGLKIGNSTLVNAGTDGRLQFTKTVVLQGNATFSNSRDLILTGQLTGTGGFTKTGTASMVLGADPNDLSALPDTIYNTYRGLTTVAQGTLYLNKQPGVNAIPWNISVTGGTLVLLQPKQIADTAWITLSAGNVNVNATDDIVGNITNSGTGAISVTGGGSLTARSTVLTGNASITISSPATGGRPAAPGIVQQTIDSGTYKTNSLELADGTMLVNPGGILEIGSGGLILSGTASPAITLVSNTSTPGVALLNGDASFTGTAGTAQFVNSGTPPIAGTVDLGGVTRRFIVNDGASATDMQLNNVRLTNGGLRKEGLGTLRLTVPSDYTLGTTIAGGTIEVANPTALGTGPITLSNAMNNVPMLSLKSDAPVIPLGNNITTGSANIVIGPDAGSTTGTFQFGNLTVASAVTINLFGPSTGMLEFNDVNLPSGTVTVNNNPNLRFNRVVSGSGALTKLAGGTLTLGGALPNTYLGATTVQGGVLELNKNAGIAAMGGNLVGQGGIVRWLKSEQLLDTAAISLLTSSSTIDLNNQGETITTLNMTAGSVTTGAGALNVLGQVNSNVASVSATISGNLSFPAGLHNIVVANGTPSIDLSVSATLAGVGSLAKTGPGTLLLSGPSSLRGTISALDGVLAISSAAPLNSPGGVTVAGGTLRTNAAMTSTRALTVAAPGGTIDTNGFDSTINSITGGGALTKNGAGALSMNALNAGSVTINSGAIRILPRATTGGNSVARVNGALSIAPSGALDLNDNDLIVTGSGFSTVKDLVLSGFGNSTGGITSSASDGSAILALFDNALIGATDWNGIPITPATIVGKYTFFGDVNFDGQVTGDDYTIIDSNLNTTPPTGFEWLSGDANLDGIVTGDDYTTIDSNLNLGSGNPLSPSSLSSSSLSSSDSAILDATPMARLSSLNLDAPTAVPEPSASLILTLGAGFLTTRRRRR